MKLQILPFFTFTKLTRANLLFFGAFALMFLSTTQLYSQVQIGTDIDGKSAGDEFGYSVSLSSDGNVLAVGSILNDDNGTDAGQVRIYEKSGGDWVQLGADINGEAAGDKSGWSISMSADGSRVAIGALNNDGAGLFAGHVRVYEMAGGAWTQVGGDIDGEAPGDRSGYSVSMSAAGDKVAIGAYLNNGAGSDAGHVRVYEMVGGAWTQLGADIDGEMAGDQSGYSVSMSAAGDKIAIGALLNGETNNGTGQTRIYEMVGGTWTQLGADIDGESPGDRSGYSISLSGDGNTVAISSIYNDDGGVDAGHVRVFGLVSGTWTQLGADFDGGFNSGSSTGHELGSSVSLSSDGTKLAIGAHKEDGFGSWVGVVRVHEFSGGSWSQVGVDIEGERDNDQLGGAVSLAGDGSIVASGALFNDDNGSNSGSVRVFDPIPAALPVELVEFTGIIEDKQVLLNWSTASENNNKGFEVQRSVDGVNWAKLDFVTGKGFSNVFNEYRFIDIDPNFGINYYRLKQVDFDNAFEYSGIVTINFEIAKDIVVYPNPNFGVFKIIGNKYQSVRIFDYTGRLAWQSNVPTAEVDISGLHPGVYMVQVTLDDEIQTVKIVKE